MLEAIGSVRLREKRKKGGASTALRVGEKRDGWNSAISANDAIVPSEHY